MIKAFSLTQSGADAAAELSIQTGIQPGITFDAWELKGVEINLSPLLAKGWAAVDADLTFQLTKRVLAPSIARIANYNDTDLILSWNMAMQAQGTPASWAPFETTRYLDIPEGVLVYGELLAVQLISTGTAVANVAWGRLFYEPKKLTTAQAMAVIASRP